MAWTYDDTDLDTETEDGRKNVVRFLVGDTNEDDQQVSDEEINFSLSETNNIYSAASYISKTIAALYARRVTQEVDRTLRVRYSDIQEHYYRLSKELEDSARKYSSQWGISFGGTNTQNMKTVRSNPLRPNAFYSGQFANPRRKKFGYDPGTRY